MKHQTRRSFVMGYRVMRFLLKLFTSGISKEFLREYHRNRNRKNSLLHSQADFRRVKIGLAIIGTPNVAIDVMECPTPFKSD